MRTAVVPLAGTAEGARELSVGAGGDLTVEIDRRAEAEVIGVLEMLSREAGFSLLSEELGERSYGASEPRILLDPVDGSLNAKRGIELYGFMAAFVDGPTIGDTRAGYVLNLVTGEEWHAVRGEGAFLDGRRFETPPASADGRFEVLGLESGPRSILRAAPLLERSRKVRVPGSMALAITYAAAGRFDVFCAPFAARVFDMAASILIAKEAGAIVTDLAGGTPGALAADLTSRTNLLVTGSPDLHEQALAALQLG